MTLCRIANFRRRCIDYNYLHLYINYVFPRVTRVIVAGKC